MKLPIALLPVATCAFAASAATPVVSDVSLEQDAATRLVTVTYTLSGSAAIVTPDILTNGVSIGEGNIRTVEGDVFSLVGTGTHRFSWRPDYDWQGQRLFAAEARLTAWSVDDPPDYISASLTIASNINYYTCAAQVPLGVTNDVYKTRRLLMRRIRAAGIPFNMGSISAENGRDPTREYIRTAILTNDFYIGVYECTQQQYQFIYGSRPASSGYGGADGEMRWYTYPASFVSTDTLRGSVSGGYNWPTTGHSVSSASFFGMLRAFTGIGFDLPVEAQWEFAARAGDYTHDLYNGYNLASLEGDPHLDEIAWNPTNSVDSSTGTTTTMPVGLKAPNAYGLYDMLGNVYEICVSRFQWQSAYPEPDYDANIGCTTALAGQRVMRGGAATGAYGLRPCRVCYRDNTGETEAIGRQDKGFRPSLTLYQ